MGATDEMAKGNDKSAAMMDPRQKKIDPEKIDLAAPAGSEKSLGAESVRDGRPSTDDSTVEAMDEEGRGISDSTAADETGGRR